MRLFGSRVHDHLAGDDIDLHITAESDSLATSWQDIRFKEALEERIGEQRVDVLVNGPEGAISTIEMIAVETGIVLPDIAVEAAPAVHDTRPPRRTARSSATLDDLISDAVEAGERTRARLLRVMEELAPKMPIRAEQLAALDWIDQLRTDSLLLQFNNMVAVVQDQLLRTILVKAEEPVERASRIDQRNMAEKIGAIPAGIDFRAIADARNEIAHQYPADPASRARLVNEVAAAAPEIIRAFDGLLAYVRQRSLGRSRPDEG